jgi:O-antigen chain-terminating methyltransferase
MMDMFYTSFESELRGSRELIKSRLRAYFPFLEAIVRLEESPVALDLGCGRGEWLELLGEQGIAASGCDLDEGMLADCQERGLTVQLADALAVLASLPDQSCTLVTGFHIAEHLPFAQLQTLMHEALRVLKPAGLLILETPNSENVLVGASSFYIDPSHERPLPTDLLAFLSRYSGFARSKIAYLQEDPDIMLHEDLTIYDVLAGSSPDYALIAQKGSENATQSAYFDAAFAKPFGVSLKSLAQRYQTLQDSKVEGLTAQMQGLILQMQAVFASRSWRITAPVRYVGSRVRSWRVKLRAGMRQALLLGVDTLLRLPILKRVLGALFGRMPRLRRRLLSWSLGQALEEEGLVSDLQKIPNALVFDDLSPRAQHLYQALCQDLGIEKEDA